MKYVKIETTKFRKITNQQGHELIKIHIDATGLCARKEKTGSNNHP